MKGKILAGVLALMTALTIAGCGSVEDDNGSISEADADSSVVDSSSDSGDDSAAEESVPDGGSLPDDASSQVLELTINSYTGEQVPELVSVVKQTLEAAAGEYSDFEGFFDPDILIEAQLRSYVNDEEQLKELKKMPFISSDPKNPARQKATPASKLYKEMMQQYNNSLRLLFRLSGDMGEVEEDSPLRKWIKERKES